MAFSAAGPMAALKTMLEGVSGIQQVYTGQPESGARRVVALVAFLGITPASRGSGGFMTATLRFFVGIGYRLGGGEQAAEEASAAASVRWVQDFYADRNGGGLLGGTVTNMEIVPSQSSAPLYQNIANQEFRWIDHIVEVSQSETFAL